MKVFVYFNLRKKCFSIKALEGDRKGLVIGHASEVDLFDVTFKVSEAGRQRVLKEQRKNVHAGAVGRLCERLEDVSAYDFKDVTYNPYRFATFVRKDTAEPVHRAAYAKLAGRSIQAMI